MEIDKIEAYIHKRSYNPSDPNSGFFLSINERYGKIVVGNGSDDNHFNVCMSNYTLLYFAIHLIKYMETFSILMAHKITFENYT